MKIEYLTKEKFVELLEIKTGECFEASRSVFMKTGEINENTVECVDLLNGYIAFILLSKFVKPVDAKIIIGDCDEEE